MPLQRERAHFTAMRRGLARAIKVSSPRLPRCLPARVCGCWRAPAQPAVNARSKPVVLRRRRGHTERSGCGRCAGRARGVVGGCWSGPPARRCWRLGSVRKDGLTIGNNFAGDVAAIATELRGALGCGALRRVRRLRRTVVSAASVHVPAQGRSRWARALPSADAAQGPP